MNAYRQLALSTLSLLVLGFAPLSAAQAQQVKVTAADPAATIQGTVSLDVTVTGSGFDSTAKPKFLVSGTTDSGGITVKKTVVKGSKQLVATIDVADTAVVANFDIEVTLDSGRKGKGTTLFAVKAAPPDPCVGAQSRLFPSFAFTRQATINGVVIWKTILSDATGQCEKVATSYSYNTFNSDLSFRYDEASRTGVILRGGAGFNQLAAQVNVTFDSSGVPTVQTSTYTIVLTPADLPIPQDLLTAGWSFDSMGDTFISPDGAAVLLMSMLANATGQQMQVFWTCAFDSASLLVDRLSCRDVYRHGYTGYATDYVTASWGARGDSIYITQAAVSGSGTGLYRLRLSDGDLVQVWSRGTMWTVAKAKLDSALHERVALYEPDDTPYPNSSLCSKVLVIDADTCSNNNCLILNGSGNPARGVTWLPDGRVAGDGQTAPNRKGKCSASGSVTAFDSNDTTGSTTTLVTDGVSPHGAGGG